MAIGGLPVMRGGGCDDHILSDGRLHLSPFPPAPKEQVRSIGTLQITVHQGASRDVMRRLKPDTFDFIYVDGSHSTVDVIEDAVSAFRLANRGAVIAFDDYQWDDPNFNHSGIPKPAIDAFLGLYAHPTRYEPLVDVLEMGWQVWVRKR